MSVVGAFSRPQIGEGGAENNRFASKAPNALTFSISDGFIEKVRLLVRPPRNSITYDTMLTFQWMSKADLATFLATFCKIRRINHLGVARAFASRYPLAARIVLVSPPLSRRCPRIALTFEESTHAPCR
jgi:hypothetical protein